MNEEDLAMELLGIQDPKLIQCAQYGICLPRFMDLMDWVSC